MVRFLRTLNERHSTYLRQSLHIDHSLRSNQTDKLLSSSACQLNAGRYHSANESVYPTKHNMSIDVADMKCPGDGWKFQYPGMPKCLTEGLSSWSQQGGWMAVPSHCRVMESAVALQVVGCLSSEIPLYRDSALGQQEYLRWQFFLHCSIGICFPYINSCCLSTVKLNQRVIVTEIVKVGKKYLHFWFHGSKSNCLFQVYINWQRRRGTINTSLMPLWCKAFLRSFKLSASPRTLSGRGFVRSLFRKCYIDYKLQGQSETNFQKVPVDKMLVWEPSELVLTSDHRYIRIGICSQDMG